MPGFISYISYSAFNGLQREPRNEQFPNEGFRLQ